MIIKDLLSLLFTTVLHQSQDLSDTTGKRSERESCFIIRESISSVPSLLLHMHCLENDLKVVTNLGKIYLALPEDNFSYYLAQICNTAFLSPFPVASKVIFPFFSVV